MHFEKYLSNLLYPWCTDAAIQLKDTPHDNPQSTTKKTTTTHAPRSTSSTFSTTTYETFEREGQPVRVVGKAQGSSGGMRLVLTYIWIEKNREGVLSWALSCNFSPLSCFDFQERRFSSSQLVPFSFLQSSSLHTSPCKRVSAKIQKCFNTYFPAWSGESKRKNI